MASNVVVGVGFLGAGMIMKRHGQVANLTTAASVWTVAAIGLAAGVGDIGTAAVASVLTLGYLVALRPPGAGWRKLPPIPTAPWP